jgi:hypothetical protein
MWNIATDQPVVQPVTSPDRKGSVDGVAFRQDRHRIV